MTKNIDNNNETPPLVFEFQPEGSKKSNNIMYASDNDIDDEKDQYYNKPLDCRYCGMDILLSCVHSWILGSQEK